KLFSQFNATRDVLRRCDSPVKIHSQFIEKAIGQKTARDRGRTVPGKPLDHLEALPPSIYTSHTHHPNGGCYNGAHIVLCLHCCSFRVGIEVLLATQLEQHPQG